MQAKDKGAPCPACAGEAVEIAWLSDPFETWLCCVCPALGAVNPALQSTAEGAPPRALLRVAALPQSSGRLGGGLQP